MNPKPEKPLPRKRPKIMRDEERYRLVAGPYEPPLVKRGFLVDEVRGKVPFATFSNALIPWPKFKRRGRGGSGGFVLCGDLLRALANESSPTICHYWGVSPATVVNWRRALEMKGLTPGAQRLVSLGVELARLPESRKKISEAASNRTMSPQHKSSLHEAMHQGWQERFEARRAAYQQTGCFPPATKADPWLPEEDELLPNLPTRELTRVLGRTPKAITARRHLLGIRLRQLAGAAGDKTKPPMEPKPWSEAETKLLGTAADRIIAERLERSVDAVGGKRRALGIPAFAAGLWSPEEEAILGQVSDAEAARQLGRTRKAVQHHRILLGRSFSDVEQRPWTAEEIALLGAEPDAAIAKKLNRSAPAVRWKRRQQGIPIKTECVRTPWTPAELALLGTMSDPEVARKLNRTPSSVTNKRMKSGIPAGFNRRWTPAEDQLLGTMPDAAAARQLGRELRAVRLRRLKLRIPPVKAAAQTRKNDESPDAIGASQESFKPTGIMTTEPAIPARKPNG